MTGPCSRWCGRRRRCCWVVFAGVLLALFLRGGDWLARRTGLSGGWGLLLFVVALLAGFVAAGLAAAPTIADQLDQLWQEVPRAAGGRRERLERYSWGRTLLDRITPRRLLSSGGGDAAGTASSALSTTFGALGNLVLILFIGLHLAADPGLYTRGVRALVAPVLRGRLPLRAGEAQTRTDRRVQRGHHHTAGGRGASGPHA